MSEYHNGSGKSTVSVVRSDEDVRAAVRRSVDLLGGIGRFVEPGETVLIKPNLIYPAPPPLTTDPRVTDAVIELVQEAGAGRIIVGEGGAPVPKTMDGFTVLDAFRKTGTLDICERRGVEVVCLDDEGYEVRTVPDGVIYRDVRLFHSIVRADKLISVPVMKTHYDTDVSLGIKCWHGVIADADKFWKYHRDDINQKLVDLIRALNPVLTLIDGITAMEGLGPLGGDPLTMNLITASADPLAVDATTARIMGFDPYEIDHFRIAYQQGVGVMYRNEIEVVGEPVERVRREFRKPDYHITGVYPNVTVIEGAVCRAERCRTRWALDQLHKLGKLADHDWLVIVGRDPYLPPAPEEFDGKIVIVGSAACYYARSYRRLPKDKVIWVEGEPPIPVPDWVPSYANVHIH